MARRAAARCELVRVFASERGDLGTDVSDFEHGGEGLRTLHESTCSLAAFDQTCAHKFGQRLTYGHAGTAVLLHQLMLEGDAIPRRPLARQNAAFDIGPYARVEAHNGADFAAALVMRSASRRPDCSGCALVRDLCGGHARRAWHRLPKRNRPRCRWSRRSNRQ